MSLPVHWRCFHCGETFTKKQERWAREHFGMDCHKTPVCLMRMPGEGGLLAELRKLEAEVERHRDEDSNILRAMQEIAGCVTAADHHLACQRAEENGYSKGLKDYSKVRARVVRLEKSLSQIRDTAIAMDDAVKAYPRRLMMIGVEGPSRIKAKANAALQRKGAS